MQLFALVHCQYNNFKGECKRRRILKWHITCTRNKIDTTNTTTLTFDTKRTNKCRWESSQICQHTNSKHQCQESLHTMFEKLRHLLFRQIVAKKKNENKNENTKLPNAQVGTLNQARHLTLIQFYMNSPQLVVCTCLLYNLETLIKLRQTLKWLPLNNFVSGFCR